MIEFEKVINAMARINLVQFFRVLVLIGLISWCSSRAAAVLQLSGGYFVELSKYFSNHHLVFLIGNAIVVLLLVLCRENGRSLSSSRDFYDDYVYVYSKESAAAEAEAAHGCELTPQLDAEATGSGGGGCEEQVPRRDYAAEAESGGDHEIKPISKSDDVAAARSGGSDRVTKQISECDDVAAAIEKAGRQIERFQRRQAEMLKREITVRRRPNCRNEESCDDAAAAEVEALSSEEFRRRVEAFIDTHWRNKREEE